jgi:uncharacterized LabA/DUF88 family protein
MSKYRTIIYIDGLNLYHGICESNRKDLLWLNLVEFANSLIQPDESIEHIRYFTTIPKMPPPHICPYVQHLKNIPLKRQRHEYWLKVIRSMSRPINIYYGSVSFDKLDCVRCVYVQHLPIQQRIRYQPKEKRTDVNIGIQLIRDAYNDYFDSAYMISGDSDFIPAVALLKADFRNRKTIHMRFPPYRDAKYKYKKIADSVDNLKISDLEQFVLDDPYRAPNGTVFNKPPNWIDLTKTP